MQATYDATSQNITIEQSGNHMTVPSAGPYNLIVLSGMIDGAGWKTLSDDTFLTIVRPDGRTWTLAPDSLLGHPVAFARFLSKAEPVVQSWPLPCHALPASLGLDDIHLFQSSTSL